MIGYLSLVLASALSARGAVFNVTVGANGLLAFDPPSVTAAMGDTVSFTFNPKNHTATQSSFDTPCTPLQGGLDSGFNPVAADVADADKPTFQVQVTQTDTPMWFHCKQPVGNHCGQGMVFAINAPATGDRTFDVFQARARATLNDTTSGPFTTPPPQPSVTVTATITEASTTITTTYVSFAGSPPPSAAPSPVNHLIDVGPNGQFIFSPSNISALINDTVTFKFHPKNHTVTQSSFSSPCTRKMTDGAVTGFASGFMPVASDNGTLPEFTITVNDTQPTWVYCGQPGHCQAGMVFSINAVESGPNNYAAFVQLARNSGNATSTAAPAPPSSKPTSAAVANYPALTLGVALFSFVTMLL